MEWLLGIGALVAFLKGRSTVPENTLITNETITGNGMTWQESPPSNLDKVALDQAYTWDMQRVVDDPVRYWPPTYLTQLKGSRGRSISSWLSVEIDERISVLAQLRANRLAAMPKEDQATPVSPLSTVQPIAPLAPQPLVAKPLLMPIRSLAPASRTLTMLGSYRRFR